MPDLAGRVRLVEKKLSWLMDAMRMKFAVSSGMLGPDGKPAASRMFEGTLNELYALQKEMPTLFQSDGHEPPPIEDDSETDLVISKVTENE